MAAPAGGLGWAGQGTRLDMLPKGLNAIRGCIVGPRVTVAGKELAVGCCWAELHLGKAALCLGYSPLPFTPHPWAPHTGPASVLQHPARVEERGAGAALPSPRSEQGGDMLLAAGGLAAIKCPFSVTSIWAHPSVWL